MERPRTKDLTGCYNRMNIAKPMIGEDANVVTSGGCT